MAGQTRQRNNNQKNYQGISDFLNKTVIVITRSGHWFLGRLRAFDNRGITLTSVMRLEPEFDENGEPVRDDELRFTKRMLYPFIVPVTNSERYHVRKMFIMYGDIQKILRAKPESEIQKEEEEKREALAGNI